MFLSCVISIHPSCLLVFIRLSIYSRGIRMVATFSTQCDATWRKRKNQPFLNAISSISSFRFYACTHECSSRRVVSWAQGTSVYHHITIAYIRSAIQRQHYILTDWPVLLTAMVNVSPWAYKQGSVDVDEYTSRRLYLTFKSTHKVIYRFLHFWSVRQVDYF